MDFVRLCRDYNIDLAGPDHHHVSAGWVGVHCPFCGGSKNYHLGYNAAAHSFNCWRCGPKKMREVLERLTGEPFKTLYARYSDDRNTPARIPRQHRAAHIRSHRALELPPRFTEPLTNAHARYLERRGFDVDKLIDEWQIASTRPTAALGEVRYSNRIFIPVHWNGRLVSFQARALKSTRANPKYKHCPRELETYSARTIVYRHPDATSAAGICVEGPTDVWRLGRHAFAPLGIGFAPAQVTTIAKLYRRVMIAFDPEPLAQERARRLRSMLRVFPIEVGIYDLPADTDPGALDERQARILEQALLKGIDDDKD